VAKSKEISGMPETSANSEIPNSVTYQKLQFHVWLHSNSRGPLPRQREGRSPVAMSFLFLQELGCSNEKRKDKRGESNGAGNRKALQINSGEEETKRNNSFIHA
jgi:hypothetical protein